MMKERPLSKASALACICLFLAALSAAAGPSAGEGKDQAAQVAQGRALAEAHCSVCHAVGLDDESPTWANSDTMFRNLHERFPIAMLEEAARTGRITGHDEMPGFDFTLEEAEALLAYIDSLAPGKPGYTGEKSKH